MLQIILRNYETILGIKYTRQTYTFDLERE